MQPVHPPTLPSVLASISSPDDLSAAINSIDQQLAHPDYGDDPFTVMLGETSLYVSGRNEAEHFRTTFIKAH